jgi:hypothetical protein
MNRLLPMILLAACAPSMDGVDGKLVLRKPIDVPWVGRSSCHGVGRLFNRSGGAAKRKRARLFARTMGRRMKRGR